MALPTLIRERLLRKGEEAKAVFNGDEMGTGQAWVCKVGVQTKCLLEVAEVVVEVEVTVEVVASEARGVALQILDETGSVKTANFLTFHLELSAKDVNLQKPQVNIISWNQI